ncbi:hypothetical protein Avbf_08564 [Armadillidium vulgare]|nr:hypothetical protein Avbf_08564 [Armadillidium vulgare]
MQSGDIPRSVIGSVLSGACRLHGSRIAENNLGFGSIANHSSARRHDSGLSSGSSGFSMNGVSPSLSSLLSEDVVKGRSSESSPVSVISSLSGNASEFTPSYSVGGKVHASNPSPSPSLFGGQVPWSITEDDLKSISYGKQQTALNLQAKEIKRPTKTIPSFLPSVLGGSVADLPLIAPQSSLSMNHVSSSASVMKPVGGGIASSSSSSSSSSSLSTSSSAFGLHTLLEASSHTEPRTVATPTTPTATKPKFQNLRSTNSIGAIGTLPPKVVRPIPRPGATTTNIGAMAGLQSIAKEDAMTTSAAYKRLMEGCKQKFGNEYPVSFIQKAIREVREQNKNSLSGLALETILEQIEAPTKTA